MYLGIAVAASGGNSWVLLPSQILAQSGWQEGDIINIAFGNSRRRARVRAADIKVCQLPFAVLRALGVPSKSIACQLNCQQKTIRLGPLVGILTTWGPTPYFRSVMRAAARRGMVAIVFHPQSLHPGARRLLGWTLVNGTVQKALMPWPDVVYNRIPNRGGELHLSSRICRRLLERARIPIFNHRFFHKWRLHRLLRLDESARQYLPETQPYRNMRQVGVFLRRYPSVYLKPNGGSKGQGIIKIDRLRGQQSYMVSYRHRGQNVRRLCSGWGQAAAVANRAMHRRTYVVQEGIPLASYHGRPFDVRVTLYKNGQGEWVPCGPAAKIAGRGSITTHVANGGRVISLQRVLNHAFAAQAEAVNADIKKAAVDLARAIERVTALELGELGLDIGLTSEGRLAMFEANSKPGRAIFSARWNRKPRRQSLLYLCDYAASLAGFENGVG